jgi:predicted nucleotidyltransferase
MIIDESDLIKKLNRELKGKFSDFSGTYFFGSRMRGDNHNYSDYDILLIFDRTIDYSFKRIIRDIIYDFMLKYDIVIDTKIFSKKEMQHPQMPFTEEVKRQGCYYGV